MKRKLRITSKGEAVLIAIECGFCPKTEFGYDVSAFELFWNRYALTREKRDRRIIFFSVMFGCVLTRLIDFLVPLL